MSALTSEISDQSLREASDWFARLDGGDATADDRAKHGAWLSASPENRTAYAFVAETMGLAGLTDRNAGSNVVRPFPPVRRPTVTFPKAIAAGIAALAVVATALLTLRTPATEHYQTATGEIRDVILSDGTKLVLNGATELEIGFGPSARNLTLKRGELFVTVGKDPARPFHVRAGDRTITDIGTAFDVNMHESAVDVAVDDGIVTISSPGASLSGEDTATLLKGQALTYAFRHKLGSPRMVAAQQVGTWRVGVLTYDQVTLDWLVTDLNRQFGGGITIADADLAAMPVTLTLKLRDRDGTIGTLEKLLPIRAVTGQGNGITLVRARS